MRSLLPNGVHLMALTATATKQTREDICRTLGMKNPVVIADSPNKPNIKYSVVRNPGTLEETFESLIEEVRKNRQLTERTIIFCRTYDSCARIYMFMKYQLRHESTEPIGAPDIGQFRLVDMFCSCTEEIVKNDILMAFSSDIVMSGSTILCCCCDVCELKCKCDVCTGKKL